MSTSIFSPQQDNSEIFILSNLATLAQPSGLFNVSSYQPKVSSSKSYRNSWSGQLIGIVTAGDDAQGINSAISAVVKMAFYLGCSVMYIKNGFRGMVEGGDNFEIATWLSTVNISSRGGTTLKTFKCPEFTERSVRLKAAKNLVEHGVVKLIAIGGDGTLKGVSALYNDWVSLLRELDDKEMVSRDILQNSRHLRVMVIVASISNDVCSTDMTIGANSATQRVIDAMDAILTNASSTQTAFIIEVIGKTSGYLALAAGVASDASMIFIPEWPPQGDWKEEMCNKVRDDMLVRQQGIMIIKSEGATDYKGNKITSEEISYVLKERLKIYSQTTVLGHFQSGGVPTAFDRLLGTRMGSEAVMLLKDSTIDAGIVAIKGSEIACVLLEKALEHIRQVEKYLAEKNYSYVVRQRGKYFQCLLSSYVMLHSLRSSPNSDLLALANIRRVGIMLVGVDALAQCIVCKAFVGYCQSRGYAVLGIKDGFEGLMRKYFFPLTWDTVKNWVTDNDCLGAGKLSVDHYDIGKLDSIINEIGLSGLVLMGSFEAYESLCTLYNARIEHKNLGIPMCMIPTGILNNVPGSDVGVGSDTALNEFVTYCDKMTRVAHANKNNVYVIEDAEHIKRKIESSGVRSALILIGDGANDNYNTDFVYSLLAEEGKNVFSCKKGVMGHVQLGGHISALDRQNAIVHGFRAAEWLINYVDNVPINSDGIVYDPDPKSKVVLCVSRRNIKFKTVARLVCETDFDLKIPTFNWWMKVALLRTDNYIVYTRL